MARAAAVGKPGAAPRLFAAALHANSAQLGRAHDDEQLRRPGDERDALLAVHLRYPGDDPLAGVLSPHKHPRRLARARAAVSMSWISKLDS